MIRSSIGRIGVLAAAVIATMHAAPTRPESTPMIADEQEGLALDVDTIETSPAAFFGRTVSVDAEVQDVLGPQLFSIDEPHWADFEDEVLVLLPWQSVAAVREDDRVTVTGVLTSYLPADRAAESAWLDLADAPEGVLERPVIAATGIVGGNDSRALLIDTRANREMTMTPAGTMPVITDAAALGGGGTPLVGRRVSIARAQVEVAGRRDGLYLRSGDERVFVLCAEPDRLTASRVVAITGVVLQMPDELAATLDAAVGVNHNIYVYATGAKSADGR